VAAKALIVGLGNPGREYAVHRHNIGFQCLDRLAAHHRLSFTRRQAGALVAEGFIAGRRVVLAKPNLYMNLSGRPTASLVRFYQIDLNDMLVVYDELDLPFGTLRLRTDGSAGGHNGMRSIIQHLGTQEFPRLRLGIERPPGRMDPAAYVLQSFSREEQAMLSDLFGQALAAIECWLSEGLQAAMNRFNRKV
jgi:PTH1 family peptidyl-tRNA hydrolase